MGNSCQSKHRQAPPSSRPHELECHVFLCLSDNPRHVVKVLNCPANPEDSFKDICGTATQIAISETKHKDYQSKRALKNFIPDWFAYKNGETCLVEDIDVEEEKRPFRLVYGPPLTSHATFIFAGKQVKQYLDREKRVGHKDEFFGPFGLVMRPNLEPHFYIRKGGKIVSYEGQKVRQGGRKPLTFVAKTMLATHPWPNSSPTTSSSRKKQSGNATNVLSAKQMALFMGERRNWTIADIERYFEELEQRHLGTRKFLGQYEALNERKNHGFTHLDQDTLFYKKVHGERQSAELHRIGLCLRKDPNDEIVIVPIPASRSIPGMSDKDSLY
mmetsp:Transcript_23847/g.38323  ORF Transcript_23847/g.38323 Transcript_23847/m.38323 type:complete len:329 (-) Transcript_23847:237-1223(-)